MRVLARNKQDIWFDNRINAPIMVEDQNGLKTGEKSQNYTEPVKARMSMAISSGANNLGSQGMVTLDPYGITTAYTHKASTEDMTCTMDEESRVWYGIEPTEIVNGQEVHVPHNFKVVRTAKSLNHLIFYLKEVDVG